MNTSPPRRSTARGKKSGDTTVSATLDFLFEAGLLKRVRRSGWWVAGIEAPESVADHCFRCAVLGYILATRENADVLRVTMMCLFNDLHEARINDAHKIASRYFDHAAAEDKAYADQIAALPPELAGQLAAWRRDYRQQLTAESILARDADILECLLQAKEYAESGYAQAALFMRAAPRFLRSAGARALWRQARRTDSSSWWLRASKFIR